MKTVSTKGDYELHYERGITYGRETDYMEIFNTKEIVRIPIFAPLKVSNNTSSTSISKLGYEYTQDDFDSILEEQLNKLSTPL